MRIASLFGDRQDAAVGAGAARRSGSRARLPCLALRAVALAALALPLLLLGASAQAAPPPIEPTPADACSPCITIVDRPAWDEVVTVVDSPAHDEAITVVDIPAYTAYRTVVDRPASFVAHHDLVSPEHTVTRSVLVTPAHYEPYQTWVSSGYLSTTWVDTSHYETTPGYWETTPGYWDYEPGYWDYEPGYWEYEPGYMAYEPGYTAYEPGYWDYEPGYWDYEPGYWEYEPGHYDYECEWWGCWPVWVSGYSSWVSGYSYWVSGYSYWVPGYSHWVSGYSYWVPGYSSWVPGYSYWVSGYRYWVAGSSYWVPPTSTWVSSGYSSSVWVDTSHYEPAYRYVDDVYATVYEVVPAVYNDWIEQLPELTHQQAYTVPAVTHEETVHHDAITRTEVVHHPALTRQVQAALFTESRQSGPRAEGTTASGVAAADAVPPIVIPVISTVTVVDRPASREAVIVVDVPERTETRTSVIAPALTVLHRELVAPETTLTHSVVVTPGREETVTAWVSSGYWAAGTWVDTSHYETTSVRTAAEYASVSEVVPAVWREWTEEVPEQVTTETVVLPAVTRVEYVERPALTHEETLAYDAVVEQDGSSSSGNALADLALLLGLTALAGAGRYASKADALKQTAAQWVAAGHALPVEVAALVEQASASDAQIGAALAISPMPVGVDSAPVADPPTRPTREEVAAMSWAERRAFIERLAADSSAGDWLNAFLGVMDYAEGSPLLADNRYMKEWDGAVLWAISEGAAAAAGQTTSSTAGGASWAEFFRALQRQQRPEPGSSAAVTDAALKRLWGIAEQAGIDEGRPWALDRARPTGMEYAIVEELKLLTDEYRAAVRDNRPFRPINVYPELLLLGGLGRNAAVPVDPRRDRGLITLAGQTVEPYVQVRSAFGLTPQGPLGIIPQRHTPPTYDAAPGATTTAPSETMASAETLRVLETYAAAGYATGDAPEDVSRAIDAQLYGSGTIAEYFAPSAEGRRVFDAYQAAGYASGDAPEDVSRAIDAALYGGASVTVGEPLVSDMLDATISVPTAISESPPDLSAYAPAPAWWESALAP
jgi:hypothetical protein